MPTGVLDGEGYDLCDSVHAHTCSLTRWLGPEEVKLGPRGKRDEAWDWLLSVGRSSVPASPGDLCMYLVSSIQKCYAHRC